MSKEEYVEKIIAIVAEQLSYDESELSESTAFVEDLNADSLELVELIMALESEFNVEVPEDAMEKIKTISDLAEILCVLE